MKYAIAIKNIYNFTKVQLIYLNIKKKRKNFFFKTVSELTDIKLILFNIFYIALI